jgi:hypothetical protein
MPNRTPEQDLIDQFIVYLQRHEDEDSLGDKPKLQGKNVCQIQGQPNMKILLSNSCRINIFL